MQLYPGRSLQPHNSNAFCLSPNGGSELQPHGHCSFLSDLASFKRHRCAEPLIHWKWAIPLENFILKIRNLIRLPTVNILHQLSQHTIKTIKFCLPWHISCLFKASRFFSISSFSSLCIFLSESCKVMHTLNRTQTLGRWQFTNHCTNMMIQYRVLLYY